MQPNSIAKTNKGSTDLSFCWANICHQEIVSLLEFPLTLFLLATDDVTCCFLPLIFLLLFSNKHILENNVFVGTNLKGQGALYTGITDCFLKILKSEGFFGLYKGVGANYMRLAPHSAFCLVFWDMLKDLQTKYL